MVVGTLPDSLAVSKLASSGPEVSRIWALRGMLGMGVAVGGVGVQEQLWAELHEKGHQAELRRVQDHHS